MRRDVVTSSNLIYAVGSFLAVLCFSGVTWLLGLGVLTVIMEARFILFLWVGTYEVYCNDFLRYLGEFLRINLGMPTGSGKVESVVSYTCVSRQNILP